MERLLLLSSVSILDGLDEEEIQILDQAVIHTEVSTGTIVQREGEAKSAIVFVKKGRLKMFRESAQGKEFTLGMLSEGNVYGDVPWFGLGTQQVNLMVMEDAITCTLYEDNFQDLLLHNPKLTMRFMRLLSDQLRKMESLVTMMALGSLRLKLLFALMTLAHDFGDPVHKGWSQIALKITHDDLAAMTGSTRESVSRTLKMLAKENLVKYERTHFSVNALEVATLL